MADRTKILEPAVYAAAEPRDRAALDALAAAIEVVRESQRPTLGKARDHWRPGGEIALSNHRPPSYLDYVDTLSWEELLVRHPFAVFDRCAGLKPLALVQLVVQYCSPTNVDAINMMGLLYRVVPLVREEEKNRASEGRRQQLREIGTKAGRKRMKHARETGLAEADKFLNRRSKPPSRAETVRAITEAVKKAALERDRRAMSDQKAFDTIDGWLKDGMDVGRFAKTKRRGDPP
jgi:hypothetical protein